MEDGLYDGRRRRAISRVATLLSRGRTAHISADDRARAIGTHRRDALDAATSQYVFPYLQNHYSTPPTIVRFSFSEQCMDGTHFV